MQGDKLIWQDGAENVCGRPGNDTLYGNGSNEMLLGWLGHGKSQFWLNGELNTISMASSDAVFEMGKGE